VTRCHVKGGRERDDPRPCGVGLSLALEAGLAGVLLGPGKLLAAPGVPMVARRLAYPDGVRVEELLAVHVLVAELALLRALVVVLTLASIDTGPLLLLLLPLVRFEHSIFAASQFSSGSSAKGFG